MIEGKNFRLVSAYAPAPPAERAAFFTDVLGPNITPTTILGIDANYVPDESLDVRGHSAAGYSNAGAAELAAVVATNSLIDVAREWLGDGLFSHPTTTYVTARSPPPESTAYTHQT
jgi:hypothetical protein